MDTKGNKTLVERMRDAVDALEPIISGDAYFSVTLYPDGNGVVKASLYNGIAELALAHNAALSVNPRECDKYPWELSAVINGIKFRQIASAEEMEAAGYAARP